MAKSRYFVSYISQSDGGFQVSNVTVELDGVDFKNLRDTLSVNVPNGNFAILNFHELKENSFSPGFFDKPFTVSDFLSIIDLTEFPNVSVQDPEGTSDLPSTDLIVNRQVNKELLNFNYFGESWVTKIHPTWIEVDRGKPVK